MTVFRKHDPAAPAGFFAAEAAGLHWLAEATGSGGVPVVPVLSHDQHQIELVRLSPVAPSRDQAADFGRRLARTHAAGAPGPGAPPPELDAGGFIARLPLPHVPAGRTLAWGQFYARYRLAPFLRTARDRGSVDAAGARVVDAVCARLDAGDEDLTGPAEPPARLHGDLWSGNVVWTATGGVLIDPAAHGGHRETDLAMLELFGLPHLGDVIAAYDEAAPLAPGRDSRIGLHQLYPLLVHAVLFGSAYGSQAVSVARRYA